MAASRSRFLRRTPRHGRILGRSSSLGEPGKPSKGSTGNTWVSADPAHRAGAMATASGKTATPVTVAITVLVAVLITETVFEILFET